MSSKHNPPLILVADDQKPTAVMLERVFEYEGYQVQSVYDGIAAIETARTLIPDLILLDINMPGISGFDVLRQLREDTTTSSIPTILITAMADLTNIVQGLNLGADDYLRKPFHPQELLARAQSKMKARQLEENLQRRTQELEALLRVGEELSQYLDVHDLLDFILYLVADLLPCEIVAIFRMDENQTIEDQRIQKKDGTQFGGDFDAEAIKDHIIKVDASALWDAEKPLLPEYSYGIFVPLKHAGFVRGALLVGNRKPYDESHLRVFTGISRQAILALSNAELYEIQANYAQHLEDMVAERTSELESAQQMLVRSEKLASVGRLAASIAHEVNNPLLPIQINLENMQEDIREGRLIDLEDIDKTLESVDRIKHIVENLLEFTRKRDMGKWDVQSININDVINTILQLNQKYFEQENVEVEAHLTPIPDIPGNKYQLEQVLMNLALNAKDAMPDGGKLVIESGVENKGIFVRVKDTGIGIPQDRIETIFEPFNSTKPDGNGLGLFISYGIIEKHNGSIHVDSKPGLGASFELRFPTPTA
jgi:two-component system NtrC family sensor kinase